VDRRKAANLWGSNPKAVSFNFCGARAHRDLFGHPRWWAEARLELKETSSFCSQPYHTQGTRRYLTRCIYSAYPCKYLRRKFSSSRIRQTSTGKNGTTRRTLHHEPSASGIAKSRSNAPEYIGCRTYAYGPVDTTGCPSSTLMVDAA